MNTTSYQRWLTAKRSTGEAVGIDGADLSPALFPHQRALTDWALRKGRAAVFADTGLGKAFMQLEWARVVSSRGRVLVLAPLAVAHQTVEEGAKFGIECVYRREDQGDLITVTNYEMLPRFADADFAGVALDESSILKSFTGKTRTAIIDRFRATPFRSAWTATPAPNDHMELGNHAEFLGVKTRTEMLAEYFVHDGGSTQNWRLKGHAREHFWRWVCSWGAMVRRPSDLGFEDGGYELPPLIDEEIPIEIDHIDMRGVGELFAADARTLNDQRKARKATLDKRVKAIADAIAAEPGEPALVWCEYNAEGDALAKAIPGAVQVAGSDDPDTKKDRLLGFARGECRVLITKPKIAGFGMNWQQCARVYFVGLSNSFEQTYQAIRRCWRFGQNRPVIVRTCVSGVERHIRANVKRKHGQAEEMAEGVAANIRRYMDIGGATKKDAAPYVAEKKMEVPSWLVSM